MDGLFALGYTQQQRGDIASALGTFEKRLDIDPLDPRGTINVANGRMALGDFDAAERLYQRAIELAPDLYIPYLRLALLHLRAAGDLATARAITVPR